MKAKLYIKGMKEPKELEYMEGKAAEEMLADSMVPPEAPFIVQGVWSGHKADMKFVDWEKNEPSYESSERVVFDTLQAKQFEKSIGNYIFDNRLTLEAEMDLLSDKGYITIKKKNPVGLNKTISDFDLKIVEACIPQYLAFEKLLDAWKEWRGKKEFRDKKETEHFEKIASQQGIA